MRFSFFHLNIEKARLLDEVVGYIVQNQIDIVNLQEVSGGSLSYKQADSLKLLKEKLPDYNLVFAFGYRLESDINSYEGNATLVKKSIKILDTEVIPLNKAITITNLDNDEMRQNIPRKVLKLTLEKNNIIFTLLNTHLAWSRDPIDNPLKLSQGKKLFDILKNTLPPFILSGDFNVTKDSQTVTKLNELARNLTIENKITNTLNPNLHIAQNLFPKGLAVDYVYISSNIIVNKFKLEKKNLSDHYGLSASFELLSKHLRLI